MGYGWLAFNLSQGCVNPYGLHLFFCRKDIIFWTYMSYKWMSLWMNNTQTNLKDYYIQNSPFVFVYYLNQ